MVFVFPVEENHQPQIACVSKWLYKNEVFASTDCVYKAVVAVFLSVQHTILDEDWDGSQDEGHKQIHVNEVSGAMKLPEEKREKIYLILFHT